jgi:cell division GTPase FtsZ
MKGTIRMNNQLLLGSGLYGANFISHCEDNKLPILALLVENETKEFEELLEEVLEGRENVFFFLGLSDERVGNSALRALRYAKENGVRTVVFAMKPFPFEGRTKVTRAHDLENAIQPLSDVWVAFDQADMTNWLQKNSLPIKMAFDTMKELFFEVLKTFVYDESLTKEEMQKAADETLAALRKHFA